MYKIFYSLLFTSLLGLSLEQNVIWNCDIEEDCALLEGSSCSKGQCVCPVGKMPSEDGTQCVTGDSPYLFSKCEETKNCKKLVVGYECNNETKTCMCQEGYHYLLGKCWPSVNYGESCISSRQCYDEISPLSLECIEGICVCKDGYYQRESGQCRKIAFEIGDECILNEDCQVKNVPDALCDIKTLVCVDPNNEITPVYETVEASVDVMKSRRLPKALADEECLTNADCADLGAAYCSASRTCVCNQGYYPSNNKKACLAELGMKNPIEGSCAGFLAKIVDEVCACPAGHYHIPPQRDCRKPTILLEKSCIDDISCRTFGVNSLCKPYGDIGLKRCVCDEQVSFLNVERQFCEPFVKFIGEPCESDDNCPGTSVCFEDICSCVKGTVPNPTMVTCLDANLELGEECQTSLQCEDTEHAMCVGGKCGCSPGYEEDLDSKLCLTSIGGACELDEDCSIENSECVEISVNTTQCQCKKGYVDYSGACYKVAKNILDPCELDVQCHELSPNTTIGCVKNMCSCRSGYHFRDRECREKRGLGEVCSTSSQCFITGNVLKSECRNSLCQCLSGMRATYNPDSCTGSASKITGLSWLLVVSYLMIYRIVN